jgi:adenosylcobinamide-GDP ribazoletransferase
MCILSRWSQVLSIRFFSYAKDEGRTKLFFSGMQNSIFLASFISALLFSVFILWPYGLYLLIISSVFSLTFGKFLSLKFKGLVGDNIGAISELSEVIILFSFIIIIQR